MQHAVAISCSGVSKSYPLVDKGNAWKLLFGGGKGLEAFTALSDLGFEVPKGQFLGILGRNGAGKSTALRVLGGVYPADKGHINIDGALSGLYELGAAGRSELTGRAYAERLLNLHGFSRGVRKQMIEDIWDFSELGDRFDDPVLTYSSGMAARLYFSTATAGFYAVYLLDEVLAVGDQHFQSKCWRRLRERVATGASGILVTHDWAAVLKLCERAIVLKSGKVAFEGPAELAARYYLYGDTAQDSYHDGVATFVGSPDYPKHIESGADFRLAAQAKLLNTTEVSVVAVIERLQPGFGWETALMSRKPSFVGQRSGCFDIIVDIPAIPLEAGMYQIGLQLVMADPDRLGRLTILAGYSWLNGNGLPLTIIQSEPEMLTLPSKWSVKR